MKLSRSLALGVAAAALALPAAASAHPGVFTASRRYQAAAQQRRLPYPGRRRKTSASRITAHAVRGGQRRLRAGFTEGAPAATPSTLTNGAPAGRGLSTTASLAGHLAQHDDGDNRKPG